MTKKCVRCASENPEDAKYCRACGKTFSQEGCPKCGKDAEEGDFFCTCCGAAQTPQDGDTPPEKLWKGPWRLTEVLGQWAQDNSVARSEDFTQRKDDGTSHAVLYDEEVGVEYFFDLNEKNETVRLFGYRYLSGNGKRILPRECWNNARRLVFTLNEGTCDVLTWHVLDSDDSPIPGAVRTYSVLDVEGLEFDTKHVHRLVHNATSAHARYGLIFNAIARGMSFEEVMELMQ